MKFYLMLIPCVLVGCQSGMHPTPKQSKSFESYSGSRKVSQLRPHATAFVFDFPNTWALYNPQIKLDGPQSDKGVQLNIRNYEWSPIILLYRLLENERSEDDLPRVDAILTRPELIENIQASESLTRYNKFNGHGLRKVGTRDGLRSEYILFYPSDGGMEGTRILVVLYGSPSPPALRETDALIASMRLDPKTQEN